jgi:hypothetical protein
VVRHLAVKAEPTEPTVSEVQVNLRAQPPFRANAVAVANQQHPDKQFGINRRPASRAVKCQSVADPSSLPASRLRDPMNQRTPCASTAEFFNTIRQKRSFQHARRKSAAISSRDDKTFGSIPDVVRAMPASPRTPKDRQRVRLKSAQSRNWFAAATSDSSKYFRRLLTHSSKFTRPEINRNLDMSRLLF